MSLRRTASKSNISDDASYQQLQEAKTPAPKPRASTASALAALPTVAAPASAAPTVKTQAEIENEKANAETQSAYEKFVRFAKENPPPKMEYPGLLLRTRKLEDENEGIAYHQMLDSNPPSNTI